MIVVAQLARTVYDIMLEDCDVLTNEQLGEVRRADHVAERWNLNKLRSSGDTRSTHLHSTEYVLVTLGYTTNITVRVAAKLHDLIEDCPKGYEDHVREIIAKWFGERVLAIVEALTKKDKATYFDQLIDAVIAGLWEVALIKPADRLHNITTIHGFANYDHEREYFAETLGPLLDFFAKARRHIPFEHLGAYEDLVLSVIDLTPEMEKKSRQLERERDLGYFPVV
jgi:(p)ppGpp synthase/HD superfamily hydrolase